MSEKTAYLAFQHVSQPQPQLPRFMINSCLFLRCFFANGCLLSYSAVLNSLTLSCGTASFHLTLKAAGFFFQSVPDTKICLLTTCVSFGAILLRIFRPPPETPPPTHTSPPPRRLLVASCWLLLGRGGRRGAEEGEGVRGCFFVEQCGGTRFGRSGVIDLGAELGVCVVSVTKILMFRFVGCSLLGNVPKPILESL